MYCLSLQKDLYVATTISTSLLPTDVAHLEQFKKTIEMLLKWKYFLKETIHTVKNIS